MFKHPKSIFAEPQSTARHPAGNRQVVIFHRQLGLTFRTISWWHTAMYFCYPEYIGGVGHFCSVPNIQRWCFRRGGPVENLTMQSSCWRLYHLSALCRKLWQDQCNWQRLLFPSCHLAGIRAATKALYSYADRKASFHILAFLFLAYCRSTTSSTTQTYFCSIYNKIK